MLNRAALLNSVGAANMLALVPAEVGMLAAYYLGDIPCVLGRAEARQGVLLRLQTRSGIMWGSVQNVTHSRFQ